MQQSFAHGYSGWESERALLEPGDVLLADRYFGCYRVLALVKGCQADLVCRLHGSRQADFRCGKRRGSLDREVVWTLRDFPKSVMRTVADTAGKVALQASVLS